MPFWHRIVIAVAVFLVVSLLARVVDWWLVRRPLPPEAATRYRVLRRTISVAFILVGLFSALLVIPQVRAVAGGLLASSAVLGVIIGFASQRTLGNFVAGVLIAIASVTRERTASSRRSASRTRSSARKIRRGSSSRTRSSPRTRSATRRFAAGRRSQRSRCRFPFQSISARPSTSCAKRSRASARPTST